MVWDEKKHTFEKPSANGKEQALGFHAHTTATFNINEIQWQYLLGQAMDLTSLMWIINICLAIQQHCFGGQSLCSGTKLLTRGQRQMMDKTI
jgi:hypothetical protein